MSETPWKPTPAQLEAARDRTVGDLVAPGLGVVFVGINPGLYTAAIGHHFGRPGNRFWKVLHLAGFTPRQLSPFEERELLGMGIGITNLVPRTTAAASELSPAELRDGVQRVSRLMEEMAPRVVAFLGMQAYRVATGRPRAAMGLQAERLGGAAVWLLPNPSGLQARYQLPELVELFGELRAYALTSVDESP
ncbi:MAG TPA: G/U mismatch-specific DNA glycosylase [Candidatus Dormibacteraeota bacterium]|nr:G/U mismatch-specific DNA glycosylase [Candidatus Dormibacteraeota bacterium]